MHGAAGAGGRPEEAVGLNCSCLCVGAMLGRAQAEAQESGLGKQAERAPDAERPPACSSVRDRSALTDCGRRGREETERRGGRRACATDEQSLKTHTPRRDGRQTDTVRDPPEHVCGTGDTKRLCVH